MNISIGYENLDNEDITVFCDMMSYVSTDILAVDKQKDKVVLDINEGTEDDVRAKAEELRKMICSKEMKMKNRVKTKVVEDYTSNEISNSEKIFDKLKENRDIIEISEGAFMYSGIFLKVFKYFVRKIEEFGYKNWKGITEFTTPVLFPIDIYEKGLYFENFPHHIMFQTTLKNDIQVLDEFSKHGTNGGKIFENMQTPELVLRHAACVPIYPMLENMNIESSDLPKTFMISGKCFRNEGHNVFELARLKEFYMKEYVFVGTQEQVLENLEKGRELWRYWIKKFGLCCKVETANDSFFASNYSKLKIFQMLGDSKQELRMVLPASDTECAVSSTNVHRTHFTKTHNIKNGDGYCVSGCIAFGIERLAYSLLCQKGINPEKWDEETRKEILGE